MQSPRWLSKSTFKSTKKAPQSLGKQEWGKHDDYIQILEYIPFEPTNPSTSSYGRERIIGEKIGFVVSCTLNPWCCAQPYVEP